MHSKGKIEIIFVQQATLQPSTYNWTVFLILSHRSSNSVRLDGKCPLTVIYNLIQVLYEIVVQTLAEPQGHSETCAEITPMLFGLCICEMRNFKLRLEQVFFTDILVTRYMTVFLLLLSTVK